MMIIASWSEKIVTASVGNQLVYLLFSHEIEACRTSGTIRVFQYTVVFNNNQSLRVKFFKV